MPAVESEATGPANRPWIQFRSSYKEKNSICRVASVLTDRYPHLKLGEYRVLEQMTTVNMLAKLVREEFNASSEIIDCPLNATVVPTPASFTHARACALQICTVFTGFTRSL